jgi:hypothetical protein
VRLSSTQTWAIVGLASLVWLGLSVFGVTSGGGLAVVWSLRDIIPGLLFVFALYERWGWRWQPLHRIRVATTPVIIGTWRGELTSDWEDESGTKLAPFTVYLSINQTLTTIAVQLLSLESSSVPVAGGLAKTETGFPAIGYLYRNRPGVVLRQGRSRMHYGGAMIEIVGDPASGLNGEYWTDRKTIGSFTLCEHSPVIAQTQGEAEKLTFGPPRPVGVLDGLRQLFARG